MDSRGIVETEKRSAHILYIPNNLSEEMSDFPLLYQEDRMEKFKGFVRQENVIRSTGDISQDGKVATITFENLVLSIQTKDQPLVATQVVTLTLPITGNATDLHVFLTIQGFVFTEPGTRAILVAHLGETTALAPLPETPSSNQSFQQVLEVTLPAGVDVQTTLFLLAEQYSSDASLNILSLDFSLDPGTV